MAQQNFLSDKTFLKLIDNMQIKELYVKITVLDFYERPVGEIQGRVTGGTVSLNGSSIIRRTCSLTLVAKEAENGYENTDSLISINKKVQVEIGVKNTFIEKYEKYGDIVWFPLGIYVICSKSITHTIEEITISLSLKDKMCLLNGECGGILPAAINFREYEITNLMDDNQEPVKEYPTIFQIIQELVNHYGGEQLGKIIINDLDLRAKQIKKWTDSENSLYVTKRTNIETGKTFYYASATKPSSGSYTEYKAGSNIGYDFIDFIYPKELTSNIGDSITSVLDKIKNTLGNFEYFYDVHGNFIFQEIKNYLNNAKFSTDLKSMTKDNYSIDISMGKSVYIFDTSNLITSYSNTPNYSAIKNDYLIWGKKDNSVIRFHLAIDKKPQVGNIYYPFVWTDENGQQCIAIPGETTSLLNPGFVGIVYKYNGEFYLYKGKDSEANAIYTKLNGTYVSNGIKTKHWQTELYYQGLTAQTYGLDPGYYYPELAAEWPRICDVIGAEDTTSTTYKTDEIKAEYLADPSAMPYFLDFIDSDAAMGEFNINSMGRRTKAINEDSINCLFEPEFPDVVYIPRATTGAMSPESQAKLDECDLKGQDYVFIDPEAYNALEVGTNYNSAYNELRNQLFQCTSYNESITIQCLPIYYLEPNTRITVVDPDSGIGGDYIIKSISLPLTVNGIMSISCTRALQRI